MNEQFVTAIQEIIDTVNSLSDDDVDNLSAEQIDIIIRMLRDRANEEGAFEAIINEMQEKHFTADQRDMFIDTLDNLFAETMSSMDSTISDKKKFIASKLMNGIQNCVVAEVKKYRGYDAEIKIKKLIDEVNLPTYSHFADMGADVYATQKQILPAHSIGNKVPLGFAMEISEGWGIAVRPRSGVSLKTGLRIANAPGTIESNYRGEVCIIIDNNGDEDYTINVGDRVAQFILEKQYKASFVYADELTDSDRGEGGFGSTGV